MKPLNEFEKSLIDDGFMMYKPSIHEQNYCTASFQKVFKDELGKKYFLDCARYDLSEFKSPLHPSAGISYEFSCQLYRKGNHAAFNLTFIGSEWTVEAICEHIESMFKANLVEHYEVRDEY